MIQGPVDRTQTNWEKREMKAVLASPDFERHPNTARLFQYLCEKHFSGTAREIKEYDIALDVFDRPPEFDPKHQSIVRVETGRLRKRLNAYYDSGEGRSHRLRIVLPHGSYAPRVAEWSSANGTVPVNSRWRHLTWRQATPAGAALLFIAALFGVWVSARHSSGPGLAQVGDSTAIPPVSLPAGTSGDTVRILCGSSSNRYVDPDGNEWLGDHFFSGGVGVTEPPVFVDGALDPSPFRSSRQGSFFTYNIPLKRATYELRLFFVETRFGPDLPAGGGENSRHMFISIDGKLLTPPEFDVFSDAGGHNILDVRTFKDVSPAADGMLHIAFASGGSDHGTEPAMVSAIELRPGTPGKLQPILVTTAQTSIDQGDRRWASDRYYRGGRSRSFAEQRLPAFMQSERYGNFAYAIPVPQGRYALTLHFAETYFREAAKRVFGVFCNGSALLTDFDVFSAAGGSARVVTRTFHGIRPDARGKILISFAPVVNYALVNAIEVIDESR